jgi:hypothetical protein
MHRPFFVPIALQCLAMFHVKQQHTLYALSV